MIVYKITNLINGKIYVGQTKFSVEKRFLQHAKANSIIGAAIRKYGAENFKIEVIEVCKTFLELNEREIFWIEKLNCKVPNGYNVADGGSFYAVKKIDGTHYVVKWNENGEIIGYFLLKEKYIDKYTDERKEIIFDEKTGEVKGYAPLRETKEKILGKDWFAVYQDPALWLGQQKMTGEQYSVLFALFHKLNFDNYLQVSRSEIAEALNMNPVNVSRAMKVLKEKSIIVEGPPAGKFKTYRLNPYIAHKGKNKNSTILDFTDALADKGKNMTTESKDFE